MVLRSTRDKTRASVRQTDLIKFRIRAHVTNTIQEYTQIASEQFAAANYRVRCRLSATATNQRIFTTVNFRSYLTLQFLWHVIFRLGHSDHVVTRWLQMVLRAALGSLYLACTYEFWVHYF